MPPMSRAALAEQLARALLGRSSSHPIHAVIYNHVFSAMARNRNLRRPTITKTIAPTRPFFTQMGDLKQYRNR